MNLEDFMWKRAWSYIHEQYVKIIKIRQDSKGVAIYDAQVLNSAEEGKVHICFEKLSWATLNGYLMGAVNDE